MMPDPKTILIVKGDARSSIGARLNQLALDDMAYTIAGSEKKSIILSTLRKLWKAEDNRFSHQFAFEARLGNQTLGMVTCYPVTLLKRLAWPTFKQLLIHRKLGLIGYNLQHLKSLYSMIILKEGDNDEFHIGTIATLPESRGLGIGTRLLEFAEKQAISHGFTKCSLTVRKENILAFKMYERMGYRITGEINKPAFSLYRMAKVLACNRI
ncbi:acetyltransferase (GNAT) family protein [Fontibacillus phaseoli]|uniref:Acetyltransferase (GNAT) family protein n=1 Tax=Fontibacillus phaseoli TaxID=1416533 RepID=A0A369BQ50_9BACL|nr:N-acetyltransferase [Fontibacillus phaseoli]RCX23760.1 acetyltransferase (GNAT) family protein [Fontibacillus phaseoli]